MFDDLDHEYGVPPDSPRWSTAAPVASNTLKLDDIIKRVEEAQKRINELQKAADSSWILISPRGEMSKGTVQQMIALLMKHHPLFNLPITPMDFPRTEK